ncbi:hypothetical protein [Saccharothrix sp. ST-888]|uniref:hypothetical protein n=1 Tax=Saccharothrix sp. ST-888 TaxID=1427391 RepID=UPI0005EC1F7C|nr:hypothetical protein [Saccharothrix sp. ST-888]KJK55226.1 hypothetical protein UK12_29945 [Saccharothrix sp. ST-888]
MDCIEQRPVSGLLFNALGGSAHIVGASLLPAQFCAETGPPLTAYGPDGHLAACDFPLRPRT